MEPTRAVEAVWVRLSPGVRPLSSTVNPATATGTAPRDKEGFRLLRRGQRARTAAHGCELWGMAGKPGCGAGLPHQQT